MVYACKGCGEEEARGFLPVATCGLLLILPAALAFGPLVVATDDLFPRGLGWWWLLAAPLLAVLSILVALLFHLALAGLEWLAFCRRPCPKCGARRWSWGYHRGFGF